MKKTFLALMFALLCLSCKKENPEPIIEPDPVLTLKVSPNYADQIIVTNDKSVLLAEWTLDVQHGPVVVTPTVYLETDATWYVNFGDVKNMYLVFSGFDGTTNKVTASQAPSTFRSVNIGDEGVRTIRLYASPSSNFYGFSLTSKLELSYQWSNPATGNHIKSTGVKTGQTMELQ